MLKYITIIFALVINNVVSAQSQNKSQLTFSLIMPDEVEGINQNALVKLENKIIQSATKYGICGKGLHSDFIIYPVLTFDNSALSSGMQEMVVVDIDFTLHIKNINDNKIFSSYSKTLTGASKTKNSAIKNAFNEIRISDKYIQEFYELAENKIYKYYKANCENIIAKADVLAKMQKFEEAFGVLMSIPAEVNDCYEKIKKKSITIYKAYLNKECKSIMINSKSEKAKSYYFSALNLAAQIDPSSSCYKEAQGMIKDIENIINAEEKKQWELQLKKYSDEIELEKIRINAVKEMAKSYYESQPDTINYYDIYIED